MNAAAKGTEPAPRPETGVRAYFEALGEGRYQPTIHAQGAWRSNEQHMACVAGLAVHALEQHDRERDDRERHDRERQEGRTDEAPNPGSRRLQIARISYDIYGQIPLAEMRATVTTLRPGRTIELVEVQLLVGPRVVVAARIWRLSGTDSAAVAVNHSPEMPGPARMPDWPGMERWSGGFIESLELRADPAMQPGRGRAWLRSTVVLVDGEPVSELAQLMGLVDVANGLTPALDLREWSFPNTDLSVHLFRLPQGAWLGLDVAVSVGPTGVGVTSATLYDGAGPFGRSEQILTLRPAG